MDIVWQAAGGGKGCVAADREDVVGGKGCVDSESK